jgi:hypothetical protein
MRGLSLLASLAFIALLSLGQTNAALAAIAPPLGLAADFAVLGASAVTNPGGVATVVIGNLGISPGPLTAITGFPPGSVTGGTLTPQIQGPNANTVAAQASATTAYNDLAAEPCNTNLTGQDLGTVGPLPPGVYCFNSSAGLTGTLHLNAEGNPNPVWVFQIASTLTTASNASVLFDAGGGCGDVFWQVGSSATLGTGTAFIGTIIAEASITLNTAASLSGSALALTGAVTLDGNAVTLCSVPPPTPTVPTLGKAFNPVSADVGSNISTLTITLGNPNTSIATLSAPLTDTLPTGVVIGSTPAASTTCTGSTATATPGGNTLTLTGGSIPAAIGSTPGSCIVTVPVSAAASGVYIDTLIAGALQTSNGNNAFPAVATLTVLPLPAPTLVKSFTPASIPEESNGGISLLTVTLFNPNTSIATLSAPLTDTLPLGTFIASSPGAGTNCRGGTATATPGGNTLTLTGTPVSIPAAVGLVPGSCFEEVYVTAPLGGNYINTLPPGALQTSNGPNTFPAVATLTVVPPPGVFGTLSKAFNPFSIPSGKGGNVLGVSILTITLTNPFRTAATLTAPLIDTLPSLLLIANPPAAGTTCGGTGAVSAKAGGSSVTLPAGRTIPASGSCTVTVNVTSLCDGTYVNTLPIGALQTDQFSNSAAATAILSVVK